MLCKKGRFTRAVSALCIASILCGSFVGCSGSSTASQSATKSQSAAAQGTAKSNQDNQKVSFTIIVPYTDEQAQKDNIVEKTLEEKTNSNINIVWTPMVSYGDKYNVIMSSGQFPDVLLIADVKGSTYLDAAQNDQFWDLTSYLKKNDTYAGFENLNSVSLDNSATDGKNYVIPRERTVKRKDVCYRADWAKKAGLDAPDTIDKIYKMAKTFAAGDFDGNGKKDTVGLLLGTVSDGGGETIDCLNELVVANGGVNGWGLKGGKMVADVTTPEYFKTIQWLRKMCQEGVVSKDFAITKTTAQMSEYVDKEKAGLWLSYGLPGLSDSVLKAKQKADPKVKRSDVYGFTYLKDASGNFRIPAEIGYNAGWAIPKSAVKDEGKLQGILRVFNYLCTKNGQRLINNGIEGRHYKLLSDKDNTCEQIGDSSGKDLTKEFNCMNQLSCAGNYCLGSVSDEIGLRLAKERQTYKDSDLIKDVSAPLVSKTSSEKLPTLNKNFDTALFKYILGQTNDSDFKAAIQQWKTDGGDKIAEEYTEAYQKTQSK